MKSFKYFSSENHILLILAFCFLSFSMSDIDPPVIAVIKNIQNLPVFPTSFWHPNEFPFALQVLTHL